MSEHETESQQQIAPLKDKREVLFLSAQVAIEDAKSKLNTVIFDSNSILSDVLRILNESDLSLLHQHDAEVRKPMVDALEYVANFGGDCFHHDEVVKRAKDALAKVKA